MPDTQQVVGTALTHFRAGRFQQAADLLKRALQRDASHPGANQLYALTLLSMNKPQSAVYFIQRAIHARPSHAEFYVNLGMIMCGTADRAGAESAFRKALQVDPAHRDAVAWLAHLLAERGAQDQSERVLTQALDQDPLNLAAARILATVQSDMARGEEALETLTNALARWRAAGRPVDGATMGVLCTLSNYVVDDPGRVLALHRDFGRHIDSTVLPGERTSPRPRARANGTRIRIGYISPDLCRHSISWFLESLLAGHDRSRFEVFVYSMGATVDDVTRRLESITEHWRALGPLHDALVADTVRRDELDVLVELSGHTMNNRLPLLTRRLAPVQATFLGYPATTGCPNIDVRLVDWVTDPVGAEQFATERLLRLPGCLVCYKPPAHSPQVSIRGEGPLTFGSFNNPSKLSATTMDLWAKVLARIPGSRLVLKGLSLGIMAVSDDVKARFSSKGIEPSRIETLGKLPDASAHMGMYSGVDIALDPTPYNGTATTCEALWMGVPVVTLRGRTHAARVGASLLAAAGMPELVADTPEDYVEIAAGLAQDQARRVELRGTLRGRLAESALCDQRTYAAGFERAIEELVSPA